MCLCSAEAPGPPGDLAGWLIKGSSVRWDLIFSKLLVSILYCIPEYCRHKHFPANLSPVTVLCPGVGLVTAAHATSREGRRPDGESLLRVAGFGCFCSSSVRLQAGLYWEAGLHLPTCSCSEKQSRRRQVSHLSTQWQPCSVLGLTNAISCSRQNIPIFGISVHISVN